MKQGLLILFFIVLTVNAVCQHNELIIELNDTITLRLVKSKFDKEGKDIQYWDENKEALTSIDGKPVYGTDATMPISELVEADLIINEKKISLETFGMYDPWSDRDTLISYELEQCFGNPLKLKSMFSYGAGIYLVEWTIVGNKSYRTMITYDMKILDIIRLKNYKP